MPNMRLPTSFLRNPQWRYDERQYDKKSYSSVFFENNRYVDSLRGCSSALWWFQTGSLLFSRLLRLVFGRFQSTAITLFNRSTFLFYCIIIYNKAYLSDCILISFLGLVSWITKRVDYMSPVFIVQDVQVLPVYILTKDILSRIIRLQSRSLVQTFTGSPSMLQSVIPLPLEWSP